MDAPLHSQLTLRAMCATSLNARSVVVLSNRMCLFGRADTCDVILDSAATPGLTSRQHAQISFDRGGNCAFVLRDMKSTNGTFHNDTRIVEAVLRQGDRVIFGVKGGNKISIGWQPLLPCDSFLSCYLIFKIFINLFAKQDHLESSRILNSLIWSSRSKQFTRPRLLVPVLPPQFGSGRSMRQSLLPQGRHFILPMRPAAALVDLARRFASRLMPRRICATATRMKRAKPPRGRTRYNSCVFSAPDCNSLDIDHGARTFVCA